MPKRDYLALVDHYEACLDRHGDSHRGVDWPNAEDAARRYQVMWELIRTPAQEASLLDFGCGASHFYEYILQHELKVGSYVGIDLSPRFIDLCREKFPSNKYLCLDVLDSNAEFPKVDYIVANGVFTERVGLDQSAMMEFLGEVLTVLFAHCRVGIAFNVMSKHVDWERDDLFHVPHDELAAWLVKTLGRHFTMRNDYGLYEFTTYVYREAT